MYSQSPKLLEMLKILQRYHLFVWTATAVRVGRMRGKEKMKKGQLSCCRMMGVKEGGPAVEKFWFSRLVHFVWNR